MISTNDIERLLYSIKRLPCKPDHYEWIQKLLDEVKQQPMTSVQITIVKSLSITDIIHDRNLQQMC